MHCRACGPSSSSASPGKPGHRQKNRLTSPGPLATLSRTMTKPPLILISPSIESEGVEFRDRSISLSEAYPRAVAHAGGIPLALPVGTSRELMAECVRRADGILLTGGDDIEPGLYGNGLPAKLRRTVETTPDGGERDLRELILVDEVFRQRKPLMAICRGHQLLNVALGGTLVVDISTQRPGAPKVVPKSRIASSSTELPCPAPRKMPARPTPLWWL